MCHSGRAGNPRFFAFERPHPRLSARGAAVSPTPSLKPPLSFRGDFLMTASPSYPLFDPGDPVFRAHEGGKLGVHATQPLRDRADLSLLYTPGVADVSRPSPPTRPSPPATPPGGTPSRSSRTGPPCSAWAHRPAGRDAGHGRQAVLFKHFAGVDAVPVCMETGTVDELVDAIVRIALVRRDQPRGHLGAPLLRDRAATPGATRHPRLPRRPARHRHRRARRPDQRGQGGRPRSCSRCAWSWSRAQAPPGSR